MNTLGYISQPQVRMLSVHRRGWYLGEQLVLNLIQISDVYQLLECIM